MPDGSQSWKIIKTSAHSSGRIAQACDRCRSKKIKCDGKLPQCTQCVNVGFECKTSDKLSRRAFPRGYTETLEQRVRTLEKELREANILVEQKNKQLSDASKGDKSKTSLKARLPNESDDEIVIDDVYRLLSRNEVMNGSFLGSSSGRSFFELFKRRLQVAKSVNVEFDEVLPFYKQSPSDGFEDDSGLTDANTSFALPAKSSAEKLVNLFFNTWHPLFPVLHRPSFQWDFEAGYTEKASKDPAQMAQMWLVLAIAAKDTASKGSDVPAEDYTKFFRRARYYLKQLQWEPTVHGLKALILAQIYAFQEENYDLLWHYKTLAVGWAYQHGLHRNQKKMKLGPLTTEMRKRVFWSLYVLDTFSSAIVGLPKMLDDNQIDAEFPSDLDDDFVTEMGFLPTPPGNFSMISAGIALFRVSKIMSRLLTQVYSPQRVSLSTIQNLEIELNDWWNGLPGYLRVDLPNCAPSSANFHTHAPMLLLVHHWIRTLMHRPVLASTLLKKDELIKSTVSLADSSRALITILTTLQEKKISPTICLPQDLVLFSACLSIMEIALVYDKSGHIDENSSKSIESALKCLRQQNPSNRKLSNRRIALLETSFNSIPTRTVPMPPKIDTRNLYVHTSHRSLSPATPVSVATTTWTPTLPNVTSNPTFDFNFTMRSGRLSSASATESVTSSSFCDPQSSWTPSALTDRFSTSPEVETSKTDLLEAFLSTISDDPYTPSQSLENSAIFMASESPTHPGIIMPTIFDWSNPSSFSDDDNDTKTAFGASPSDVSPNGGYVPMFLGSFSSGSDETSPGGANKGYENAFKTTEIYVNGYGQESDGNSHIHTAPNLFSEETGWGV